MRSLLTIFFIGVAGIVLAQETGTVRGFVYEESTGEPVLFTHVFLDENLMGSSTNVDGFFSIPKVPVGEYTLKVSNVSYDEYTEKITIEADEILNLKIYLKEGKVLDDVNVSARQKEKTTKVQMSMVKATKKDIISVPTIGGEADIATYFQTVPGVVNTGDQGGQLYVRGGTPIQNQILLDGMTIYNPFHSIGFFSIFDTELIRSADIYTGGFDARYAGRISSVMDITTRDGNRRRIAGRIGVSPFLGKALIEGPLYKAKDENSGSASFIVSAKGSILDLTSKTLYPYVNDGEGMPFNFLDLYSKLSFSGASGNKFNVFGFHNRDQVNYSALSEYKWQQSGGGLNFLLAPTNSPIYIKGNLNVSNYAIGLEEEGLAGRSSEITGFDLGFDFSYFLKNDGEIDYGIEISGFSTDFSTFNSVGRKVEQVNFSFQAGAYVLYRWVKKFFVLEPSVRFQYYAALSAPRLEPRLRFKINAAKRFRIKGAVGMYSQNFTAATSDRDVVNLFYGFLSAPENYTDELSLQNGETRDMKHSLQLSNHFILGFEFDITENLSVNLEGYYKMYPQLTNLNRNKIYQDVPDNRDVPDQYKKDFIIENGEAYGGDLVLKYTGKRLYVWTVYSLSKVTRWDGQQEYSPVFDRRHNVNLVATYAFGKDKSWEVNARFNFGSGLPFTQTLGNYETVNFADNGINTDYTTSNANEVEFILADLNGGRMPSYHRLDISAKKIFEFKKNLKLEVNVSVTNVYNRKNVFYVNRATQETVYQLPILPSLGVNFFF